MSDIVIPSGLKTVTVTVNFATPSRGKFFDVTVDGALPLQKVFATPSLEMPQGVTPDELELDPVICYGSCVMSNTVRLFVGSADGGILGGERNINLLIG
jgi:hypothetical protein